MNYPERRKDTAQPTASTVPNKPACPGGISFFQITLEQTDTWEYLLAQHIIIYFTTPAGCGDSEKFFCFVSEQLPASENYSSGMSMNRQRVQINLEILYSLTITKYRC